MNIYVCVKHVPDTAATIRVGADYRIDEDITFIMNPYDENAVEEAVRLKKRMAGAEVIAVTLGKAAAEATLRSALAMGADRAILVRSDKHHDCITTAGALCAAIRQDGNPDLIFTGRESIDAEGFQTMYRMGVNLGIPVASNVIAFDMDGQRVSVISEMEAGEHACLEMTTPCIIGAGKGLNQPSYPKLPDILQARKKTITVIDEEQSGTHSSASRVETVILEIASEERQPEALEGSAEEIADAIVGILRNEAKVLMNS
ncbi:MAG: electron transfer flavoprotein subunit beta/FixA family protein [Deltaproteobacteria bacterium]|nr:electron transfer flavoprotein subunit beta/FixA family protein [Deltaproteobacteria bacterium]MBW2610790.1 electron transfer flavoprotein subunit beta/FixA family protein [Deltaproteobacteria bacterium]MBW2633447.1 electron transfer flavoprotein subunit beta/FixA family protein [Deltaproteobacteria bacterium]MBW2676271.1 electron transfer flavoprotein subunit beta/FixA family protein [Deltaproteobacteria bacterium]